MKRKMLNVRAMLERMVYIGETVKQHETYAVPALRDELIQIAFLAKKRLAKHTSRKDLYVEVRP